MHNVWLGTCKRIVLDIFLKRGYLTNEHLNQMADMCGQIILPIGHDSSSLARKIYLGSGFSYMEADEWRVFTVALSPLLLKGRLDTPKYKNWIIFVECMQVMSLPAISKQNIEDERILSRVFEIEDMLNYGPWASHQCFNYERYNSDLKNIRTNGRKGLERPLVKRMLSSIHHDVVSSSIPSISDPVLDDCLKGLYSGKDINGKHETYVDTYLRDEMDATAHDDGFDMIRFVSFSGHLNGIG